MPSKPDVKGQVDASCKSVDTEPDIAIQGGAAEMSPKQQAWGTVGALRGAQREAATRTTPTGARELTATMSCSPETGRGRRRRHLGGGSPGLMCDCWARCKTCTCVAIYGTSSGAVESGTV